jgi:hypothetical protein
MMQENKETGWSHSSVGERGHNEQVRNMDLDGSMVSSPRVTARCAECVAPRWLVGRYGDSIWVLSSGCLCVLSEIGNEVIR